jgi:ligand-binding sensor domain-containing protein
MMEWINLLKIKRLVQNIIISGIIICATGCSESLTTTTVVDHQLPSSTSTRTVFPSIIALPLSLPEYVRIISSSVTVTPKLSSTTPTKVVTVTSKPIILDPKKWEYITLPSEDFKVTLFQFAQAKDGVMWIVGENIYRYDFKNWTTYTRRDIPSLNGKRIDSLTVDSNDTVWFGTSMNEIVSFDGKNWTSQPVEEGGYRENDIYSILIRKNGELCAISNEGLSCRKKGGGWIRHPIAYHYNKYGRKDEVHNAILSPTDEIWISLYNGWLYHYDGKNWEDIQVGEWMGPIALASDGSLWIFAHEGLVKRTASGKMIYQNSPDILYEYPATVMYEADDGTLWIGCIGGRGGYQIIWYKKNGDFETVDNKLISIRYDSTYLNSMYPFGNIENIYQSNDGSIWLGTYNGIFRYHSN